MTSLQLVGAVAAIVLTVIGAIGGLWGLLDRWMTWRESKRLHGQRRATILFVHGEGVPTTGVTMYFWRLATS